jgi:hypothetical protein
LIWNVFPIPNFLLKNQKKHNFAQITSRLIINLYDAENSFEENVISIAMLLFVKFKKNQNIVLPPIINFELVETLQSYWEYEEDKLLFKWMKNSDIIVSPFIFCFPLDLPEDIFNIIIESDKKK